MMGATQFQVDDLVVLTTGSPAMRVARVNDDRIVCSYSRQRREVSYSMQTTIHASKLQLLERHGDCTLNRIAALNTSRKLICRE